MADFSLRLLSRHLLHPLVLPLLLASCARGEVDLGAGTPTVVAPRGARCLDSTVIDGAVVVHDQDELAALAGCEEIHGDLFIRTFQGADLTPLSSLRSVEGELRVGAKAGETPVASIGSPAPESEGTPSYDPTAQEEEASNALGWLTSLAGLEGLESVGSLTLYRTSVLDLKPLSQLRGLGNGRTGAVSPSGALVAGQLAISGTRGLRDLAGLERAAGLSAIAVDDNQDLESLDGLLVTPTLNSVSIQGEAFHDLGALAPLTTILMDLSIEHTGVQNLDALSQLSTATQVVIDYDDELVDASGLSSLSALRISLSESSSLKRLPSFSRNRELVFGTLDLRIVQDRALESINLDFLGIDGTRADSIEIDGNQALRSISSPAEDSSGRAMGFAGAALLGVRANPSLTKMDLSSFQTLSNLIVKGNPSLTQVDISALQTVDTLSVTDNPQLSTANFAAVRTFDSTMNGNADDAPAP